MFKRILFALSVSLFAAAGIASTALAGDKPWTGFYFGAGGGYAASDIGVNVTGTAASFSVDHNVAMMGAILGYQYQWGNIVLGAEGSLSSVLENDRPTTPCPGGGICSARLTSLATAGGRAGWAAGQWMPYVSGGYAKASFTHEVYVGATLDNTTRTKNEGWYVGGGLDWLAFRSVMVGVEYRHYDFDASTGIAFTPAGAPVNSRTVAPTTDTIMARLSLKLP